MKRAYNDPQVQMYRGLVTHYSEALGVGISEIAESAGISRERLEQFVNFSLPELNASEFDRLRELLSPLANGEAQDIGEYNARGMDYPGKSYQNVIAEVVQLQGGEKE